MLKIDSFKLGVDEKVKMPDVTIIDDIVRRMKDGSTQRKPA